MISRRRVVISLGAGVLAPLASFAQQPGKVWRIGFLGGGLASNTKAPVDGFRQGLRDLGYVEGQDFVLDFR